MTEIPDLPIVPLRGSEGWQHAYDWGRVLDAQFPGQDADDFAYACTENDSGPAADRTITELVMAQQGPALRDSSCGSFSLATTCWRPSSGTSPPTNPES